MNRRVRLLSFAAAWALAAAVTGCETLGLSPPNNPILPEAKSFRAMVPQPVPVPRELAKELHPAWVVEPGDTLLVQPAELDAPVRLPPDQPVFPDGTIDLGIYGRPVVAGKTLPQIESQVQALVVAKEKPKEPLHITVRLIGRASKVYYVLGEVNAPGVFPINGRETVLDGIVQAGGLTRRASKDMIILSRPTPPDGCRVVYPVCYNNIVQLGDTTTNYQLQPGDRIFVPSRGTFENLFGSHGRRCHKGGPCDRLQVPCVDGCGSNACGSPLTNLPAVPLAPAAPAIGAAPTPGANPAAGAPTTPVVPVPSPFSVGGPGR